MVTFWNSHGLIPPVLQNDDPTGSARAPYKMQMDRFVGYFKYTQPRIELLRGLLGYRALLYDAGISSGFQWINGSFVENIEYRQKRSPNDIDCVTFFKIPGDESQKSFAKTYSNLFDRHFIREKYHIDSFYVIIDASNEIQLIEKTYYWYSVWSHNRDYIWKGFIELQLDKTEDISAQEALNIDISERENGK